MKISTAERISDYVLAAGAAVGVLEAHQHLIASATGLDPSWVATVSCAVAAVGAVWRAYRTQGLVGALREGADQLEESKGAD